MSFTTQDQLAQGANTLSAITGNVVGGGILSQTLDMDGREAAVAMILAMSDGFKQVGPTDPAKLETFITGVTGSAIAIMEVTIIILLIIQLCTT